MIGVRLRYTVSGLVLRLRALVQFEVSPQSGRHGEVFRAIGMSFADTRSRGRARVLATVLGQSYVRARLLAHSMSRHMGTGRHRPKHLAEADLISDRLTALSEVDDPWELTFAIARVRDLAAGIPNATALTRTLADAHDIARDLALSGAEVSTGVLVLHLNPLSRVLLSMSVFLLPAEHRDRFSAEFRAELYDLRPSRRRQIRYAARQLRYALVLRRSLRQANGHPERRTDT
ncbi:hypothetical protein [Actinophytocola gossypii]|uniref:Uncharacterized protein n=1 Tax=Actinophytocola gossypii TaxID=2812003 RepID=A0ABT2JJP3_9PSEU|nr:hypothetical protein [Actinophytocola gossypii]MCT2588113.1 hypothetical protein [Actinophytocola gossypii]